MLIGGVKDVLLEQGQTGGDEGSQGGDDQHFGTEKDPLKTNSSDACLMVTRGSELGWFITHPATKNDTFFDFLYKYHFQKCPNPIPVLSSP